MDIERQNFLKEFEEENKMKKAMSIKEKMLDLEKFFMNNSVNPADFGHNITVNGGKVTRVSADIEIEGEDYTNYEDLTDDEVEELWLLKEEVEADEYKTQKRISD
jgi:hypothetical protein